MISAGGLALVLLAAGQGRRFGGGKLAADFRGEPLLFHAARTLSRFDFPAGRFVVASASAPSLSAMGYQTILLEPEGAPLSRSLALGLGAAQASGAQGVMMALGDMPLVPRHHIEALLSHFDGDRIATQVGHHRQPPAILGRRHFPALLALQGDKGAGALLHGCPVCVLEPEFAIDIDTLDDLDRAGRLADPQG
ncbi:MAG: NTP transferase domain-containing protein [Sphingomonadales bacterium]|nr:NTP transferase domain-containing protein [Sphingomonadales bacterium]MDE2167928.1 NTP transferase domain-containing protein [Sphingomonadales bacterium]